MVLCGFSSRPTILIRLEDWHDVFDAGDRAQVLQMVFVVAVTDRADDHPLFASNHVGLVAVAADAFTDLFDLFFGCM